VDAADAQPPARPLPQYLRDRCSGSRPACGDPSSNQAEPDPRPGETQQKIAVPSAPPATPAPNNSAAGGQPPGYS
jgi:hypothetical protein